MSLNNYVKGQPHCLINEISSKLIYSVALVGLGAATNLPLTLDILSDMAVSILVELYPTA
jgi:hypothetical protein